MDGRAGGRGGGRRARARLAAAVALLPLLAIAACDARSTAQKTPAPSADDGATAAPELVEVGVPARAPAPAPPERTFAPAPQALALDLLPRLGDRRKGTGCRVIGGAIAYVITDYVPATARLRLADREVRTFDFVLED